MFERRVLENLLDQQWVTCHTLNGLGKKAIQRQSTGLFLKGVQRRVELGTKIALRLQVLVRSCAATAVLKVNIGHERQVSAENFADAGEICNGHGRVGTERLWNDVIVEMFAAACSLSAQKDVG